MKKYISHSIILAAAATGMAHGQATAYTIPVGYVSLGNAGVVAANTDMTMAIPLDRPAVYTGAVSTASGAILTFTGTPAFTVNQFTNTPHVIKVETGTLSGLVALVVSNTATTVTVAFQNNDSFVGLTAAGTVSVRPAWTVKSFFAGNTVPNFCELGVWDASLGTDLAPDKVYYNFGGDWFDQADDSDANNIVVYPNEGFRLRNTSGTAITNLVVAGEVPKANSRVFVNGNVAQQDTRLSYFSPVPQSIGSANVGAGNFDQLLAYDVTATGLDNAPSQTYYYFNGSWFNAADDSDVTATLQLQPGQGYIYRSEAGRADTTLSDPPSYSASL